MVLWSLAVAAATIALGWVALAARSVRYASQTCFLDPDDGDTPADVPIIDAVIPAHNEQAHIRETLSRLEAIENCRLRITVVNDQSTDRTGSLLAELAREPGLAGRLRVLEGLPRPEGWVGKTWAVAQGVRLAGSDWLLFVDADMGLHPQAVRLAYREATRVEADLVSLAPRIDCGSFWQAVMALHLIHMLSHLYPAPRVNDPADPVAMAVGGFILVRREAYERAGGHEAVRSEIVDDIRLARRIQQSGGRLRLCPAPALAWTHMYGTFAQVWRGLRKNAYAGMGYKPHRLAVGAIGALLMAWGPIAALVAGLVGHFTSQAPFASCLVLILSGIVGLLTQALSAAPAGVFLGLPVEYLATVPLGITVYVAIALASAWHYHRGWVLWKDRRFDAPRPRTADPRVQAGLAANGGPPDDRAPNA